MLGIRFYRLMRIFFFFFFNDTATTEIYTLSLHDALPIYSQLASDVIKASDAVNAPATTGRNRR